MIEQVLGSDFVTGPAARLTRSKVRILAYHGVDDPDAFATQVEYLVDRWHPVTAAQVLASCGGADPLPERAVWVTFDDGLHSTVTAGRDVLDRFGVSATVFVNPGVLDGIQWWRAVEEVHGAAAVRAAKTVDDVERREIVAEADAQLGPDDRRRLAAEVATVDELRAWVAAGHTIGNHTWDHPCLDRCSDDEQREQVDRGGHALAERGLMEQRLFAYPNGNWSQLVDGHLRAERYEGAVLFDHRLADLDDALALSRLRVDAAASLRRFKAIMSGLHPTLMRLRDRAARRPQSS